MAGKTTGGARTAPNGLATRQRIRQAALQAFAEQGYQGASLRDVARRVGIEVGSLYNHIDSKEDLLFELVEVASMELLSYLEAGETTTDGDPRGRLLSLVERNTIYHARNQSQGFVGLTEMRALTDEHRRIALDLRGRMEALFKDAIQGCITNGYLPSGTPVTVMASFVIGIGTNVGTWYRAEGPMSAEEVGALAVELVRPWLHQGDTSAS